MTLFFLFLKTIVNYIYSSSLHEHDQFTPLVRMCVIMIVIVWPNRPHNHRYATIILESFEYI